MYAFNYLRVTTVAEAAAALGKDEDARLLAGGQSLVASMKLRLSRPSELIDLSGLDELRGIAVEGGKVKVGAMMRHAEVARSADVRTAIPALASLADGIGDRQVRNMGTIGGSVANNDPAADYPAAVLGLNGTITTNEREIAADEFFKGMFETSLRTGEIITQVTFPVPRRAAYMKFKHPASRFAIVGVFVAETALGPRVAVTGAGPGVFRVPEMERALASMFAPEAVANIRIDEEGLNSDIQAPADYRAHLVIVMAKRAVAKAIEV